jgi:hypothetical protein
LGVDPSSNSLQLLRQLTAAKLLARQRVCQVQMNEMA